MSDTSHVKIAEGIHHAQCGLCLACRTVFRHDWPFPDRAKETLPCDCGRCAGEPFPSPPGWSANRRLRGGWEKASRSFPVLLPDQTMAMVATSPTGESKTFEITLPGGLSYD